jgi:phosphoribosyl 1,2-cyclic phosphate phosphodiesterase
MIWIMQLVFLGTGTSTGVPMVGCGCAVCKSPDPRNQRTRSSVLMQLPGGNVLVDTTPEMRMQLLREGIGRVDAVLLTHYHADHIFGLDDVRVFPKQLGHAVPVWCERPVQAVLRRAFAYAFDERLEHIPAGGIPKLELRTIDARSPFEVLGTACTPIRLLHGPFRVLGFRFGRTAYCTDVSRIPARSMEQMKDLDVLVLDALRDRPHPTHFSLDESLEVVRALRPRRCFFTHIAHDLDHRATSGRLPAGVALAYDGLRVDCE